MSILVSGSLAYDYILDVPDQFADHLLPDQLHILSVCFAVKRLERSWGGTAGNIAYAMRCLEADPTILSSVGSDGGAYLERLQQLGIRTTSIYQDSTILTAAAHIMTDKANNQITAFFSGPLEKTGVISLKDQKRDTSSLVLVSPNPKEVMAKHLLEAKELGIKGVFDPGQQITTFSPDELRTGIEHAWAVVGNDYEMKLLAERTGWSVQDVLRHAFLVITTLGAEGSLIQTAAGQTIRVPACPPRECVDPTGAGDAFRAGFFVGYDQGKDLKVCAQMGSVLATYAIETYGTQAYSFTKEEFGKRYEQVYGEEVSL